MYAPAAARRSTVPQLLFAGALASYCVVFVLLTEFGRPGLGISQGFYLAIALIGLAGGPVAGAVAGLAATLLYATAIEIHRHVALAAFVSLPVGIRLVTYVTVGFAVGYVARSWRGMLARSLRVLDDLLELAGREPETAFLSGPAFENDVLCRVAHGWPFAIVLGEVSANGSSRGRLDEEEVLRSAIRDLRPHVDSDCQVARAGPSRVAVLVPGATAADAAERSAELEQVLGSDGRRATVGWAAYPGDETQMLALLQTAVERLHVRRDKRIA
jgi:hypothetical protein